MKTTLISIFTFFVPILTHDNTRVFYLNSKKNGDIYYYNFKDTCNKYSYNLTCS